MKKKNDYYEWNCKESVTVVSITKVQHRTAWALMSNGETKEFNQPKNPALTPGLDCCIKGEKVRTDKPLHWTMSWILWG